MDRGREWTRDIANRDRFVTARPENDAENSDAQQKQSQEDDRATAHV